MQIYRIFYVVVFLCNYFCYWCYFDVFLFSGIAYFVYFWTNIKNKVIMKTIEEAAKEISFLEQLAFKEGVKFAQRWIPVEEELPICYETGSWDGMRSEFVLARNKSGYWTKARLYSGTMDGSAFGDWVDENDFIIDGIVEWRPIELILHFM